MGEFTVLVLEDISRGVILDNLPMTQEDYSIGLFDETQVGVNEQKGGVIQLTGEKGLDLDPVQGLDGLAKQKGGAVEDGSADVDQVLEGLGGLLEDDGVVQEIFLFGWDEVLNVEFGEKLDYLVLRELREGVYVVYQG